ncbi:N,N-dimethylformamidase beta subunit family domain-containing protein [Actinophytocola sp.]|uniref:N,N-dimethylformamidase beta subunit family domain-containing protein n=1 Tax=Actinophytocola sp. TaxID=1872138 RepID=UPI002ED5F198
MTVLAHASDTSVRQGDTLAFHLPPGRFPVSVRDVVTGHEVYTGVAEGPVWSIQAPWRSSLYRAEFGDGGDERSRPHFVVRPADPGASSAILVSVPFPTWEAYNHLGVPGEGMYLTEQPDRAVRVRLDRPGGGPENAGDWEMPFYRWLSDTGRTVEYCSALDLHTGAAGLDRYRLLICAGHDEYWSWEMRDNVEAFVDTGGNLAFFTGNTCWWQVRFEDDLRTMVCYRDAAGDPMSAVDPRRVTVEWSSAPVNRPENSLTGVSFRRGAGCWEDMSLVEKAGYTARFAQHWVFDGTGLRDGEEFATGAVGYETDAADFEEIDGVPRVTGRDGTPPEFVVLATADLRHWRGYGQGGHATMGIFRRGLGTVFNAATVNWVNRLTDVTVARITANVVDRLSAPRGVEEWEDIGSSVGIRSVAACEHRLFGVTEHGKLSTRDISAQNLAWRTVDDAPGLLALAAPRETNVGRTVGLYGLFADRTVAFREPLPGPAHWDPLCRAPEGTRDLAVCFESLFAVTEDGALWALPLATLWDERAWRRIGEAAEVVAMTGLSGRLYAATANGTVKSRLCDDGSGWVDGGHAPGVTALAGYAGWLICCCADGRLRRRAGAGWGR